MISRSLGLNCSTRCELLLSFAYLQDKQNIIAYAHCLANDERQNAIRLAKCLKGIPQTAVEQLIKDTFNHANIKISEKKENIFEEIKTIIKNNRL